MSKGQVPAARRSAARQVTISQGAAGRKAESAPALEAHIQVKMLIKS